MRKQVSLCERYILQFISEMLDIQYSISVLAMFLLLLQSVTSAALHQSSQPAFMPVMTSPVTTH